VPCRFNLFLRHSADLNLEVALDFFAQF